MKTKNLTFIILIIILMNFIACTNCKRSNKIEVIENQSDDSLIKANGTVKFNSFEGGFFGIIDKKGNKYNPIKNFDEEFQIDGLQIYFEAKELKEVSSFRMWGKNIEILSIEKIESED